MNCSDYGLCMVNRNFQDYYAECLCAKYMAVLAMYMGDRAVAERIKQDLHISFERASHWRELVPSDYSWSTFAFYTMAQIDRSPWSSRFSARVL